VSQSGDDSLFASGTAASSQTTVCHLFLCYKSLDNGRCWCRRNERSIATGRQILNVHVLRVLFAYNCLEMKFNKVSSVEVPESLEESIIAAVV